MYLLSDEALLQAYWKAVDLNLEQDFIQLLKKEIEHRGLDRVLHEKMGQKQVV
ncbi:MAG: sporulation histidine kinase inhibitor Sda [Bacillaceae bacterium]|nr:sporulation histidine kinase inhibitor Sda [Bacillaceae bacterium]